jgi:hypothetical protein
MDVELGQLEFEVHPSMTLEHHLVSLSNAHAAEGGPLGATALLKALHRSLVSRTADQCLQ